ncbi:MAG: N-methyl-L-tryptophan oxidase [Planctomycetota bacterium]
MTTQKYDAIVLGTGGVGSAAMYHLARRGLRVLGLDRFPVAHDQGSSHGESRAIRQAYFEHPEYVPLILRAYELWRELESETGAELLVESGLLQVGPSGGEVIEGVFRAAELHGLQIERLTPGEIERRFPQFTVSEDTVGAYESAGGYLHVEASVEHHLQRAGRLGAEWIQEPVLGWAEHPGFVEVQTANQRYNAEKLVVCAGPWANRMLLGKRLSCTLTVLSKHMRWYATDSRAERAEDPVFLFEEPGGVFYGFPAVDGKTVKVAEHSGGEVWDGDPRDFDRSAESIEQSRIDDFVAARMKHVVLPAVRNEACFYTVSPDEHFILGEVPDNDRIVIATGLSGHGFKFAPVLGQAIADLVQNGSTDLPIDFLSPERFG